MIFVQRRRSPVTAMWIGFSDDAQEGNFCSEQRRSSDVYPLELGEPMTRWG